MKLNPIDKNDKYAEYAVEFHGNVAHSEEETLPEEPKLSDWHNRHEDKLLDNFCDGHPSAPQCKVFDD